MKYTFLLAALLWTQAIFCQEFLKLPVQKSYTGYMFGDFISEVEQEFAVQFFYKKDWIDNVQMKSLFGSYNYQQLLEYNLAKHQLSHIQIQGSNIILIPSGYQLERRDNDINQIKTIGNPLEKGKYLINKVDGYVYYGKTGDPIIGAVIYDPKSKKQTTSDYTGYYAINLPGGKTSLEFSFIGLEKNIIEVDVYSPGKLDCELMEASVEIEAINIIANGGKSNLERTQMGVVHVDMKSLNKLPVLMGEPDIVKSMTLLPGVQSSGEMSSGFNVRGGNTDQNLILIDGAPIYNTSHLFGLFSALIPNAVSTVNLHKGTQPANYGGRLSSVMEIGLKKPDTTKIGGKAGIGILNSSLFVEGPIKSDFCSFFVGGRTTYSNWILKKIPDIKIRNSETEFYDLIGKVNFQWSKKNQLSFHGYYSQDYFNYANENTYNYGSFVGGMNYRLYLNNIVSFKFNAAYTNYSNDLAYVKDPILAYNVSTGIEEVKSKMELNLHLVKNDLLIGAEANHYVINPGAKTLYGNESTIIPETLEEEKAKEISGFVQDNFALTDRISLLGGLRYTWYSKYGPSSSLVYNPNQAISENSVIDTLVFGAGENVQPYSGFEPRLGLKFEINKMSSIKAGYHLSRQYQHLISNSASATPSDYWKSVDKHIKPMLSHQYSVGYFRNFMSNVIETSAELYYKSIDNLLEYRNGAVLVMNNAIEQSVLPGNARAYGLELMMKKNAGKFKGWVSYTISKSEIKVDGAFDSDKINQGNYFPTYNDRLHDLSVSVNYQLTRRWNFAGNFILISGRPATFPEKKYIYRGAEVVNFSDRNKYRLAPYHRLDLSLTYEGFLKKTKKVHPSFTFGVYNVYGRKNAYSVYYKSDTPSDKNDYNKYGLYQLSIIGIPIPSATLNLTF